MVSSRSDSGEEQDVPIGRVIRLGKDWVAVLHDDGSILLQHLSQVCLGGSGEIVDLLDPQKAQESAEYYMKELEDGRIAVRTLLLKPDGSVVTDEDAISPAGLLTGEDSYTAIHATQFSASRYFSRKSNKGLW